MMERIQVFKGNIAYTKEPGRFELDENGYLIVKDSLVAGVFPTLPEEFKHIPIEDLGDGILIPAFTDLHLHAPQLPNTGIGYDLELMPWLEQHTFPLESCFSDIDFAEKVYPQFIRALWKNGLLHSIVLGSRHWEATELLIDLFIHSGLNAYVGKVNMDRNAIAGLVEDTSQSIRETDALIQKYQGVSGRVKYIITPRFVPCTTPALMAALGVLARAYGVPVQSHLSENRIEIELVKQLHPEEKDFTSVYEKYGLLGQTKTVMAHCIHNTDDEVELLKSRGVYIAHCPQSNLNLSSGIMPLRKYIDRGLKIGLGSDVGAGNTLNMWDHIALAIQCSKMYHMMHKEYAPISSSEAFYLATKGGGSFWGKTGSFEKGYAFDALVLDDSGMNVERRPLKDRMEKLIYCGDERNITARYLEGIKLEEPA